jgi:hypothetical protein
VRRRATIPARSLTAFIAGLILAAGATSAGDVRALQCFLRIWRRARRGRSTFAAISVSDGQGNIDRMLAKMQRRHN